MGVGGAPNYPDSPLSDLCEATLRKSECRTFGFEGAGSSALILRRVTANLGTSPSGEPATEAKEDWLEPLRFDPKRRGSCEANSRIDLSIPMANGAGKFHSADLPNSNQHRVEPEQMLQNQVKPEKLRSTFFQFPNLPARAQMDDANIKCSVKLSTLSMDPNHFA